MSMFRLSFFAASPSSAVWQMDRNRSSSTSFRSRSSKSSSPKLAGVEVAQDALHVRGREDLAYDIEYRVVVEGVADLLELVQQPLQDPSLDGVGRDEVEDQAVELLSVAVDAAHPLFEAVRIPRDVVVEEDVAALQVDPFAGRFGGGQDLDGAFAKLLLGVEPGSGFVARAGFHAAVDAAHPESPRLEAIHQVVEGVPELREDQQPLVGTVEEPLVLHDRAEAGQLSLAAGAFDRLRFLGKLSELGDLLADLIGVPGQRVRLQDPLQPLAFGFLQLVELVLVGDVGPGPFAAGRGRA